MRDPVGYVGVGNMGGAVATALARSGPVVVYDRSPAAMAACTGTTQASDLGDLSRRCQLLFLCLPTFDAVRSVLADGSALIRNAAPGTLIVDQSTSPPDESRRIAERLARNGLSLVDAPVSGGPQGVLEGTALFTVGGTEVEFDRVASLLRPMSPNVLHTGPAGSAMVTKIANNYVAAMQAAVSLQALAFAVRSGCDPEMTAQAFLLGSGSNHYIRKFMASHVLTGNLGMAATIEVMQKDVVLAIEAAQAVGLEWPGQGALTTLIDRCVDRYGVGASYNALALILSDDAQVPLGRTRGATLSPPPEPA